VRRRRVVAVQRDEPADRVLEAGRDAGRGLAAADVGIDAALERVAVAGHAPHRRPRGAEVELGRLPAEHRAVERLGRLDVGRVEVAPVPRPGRVDELRADVRAGLPEREARALRVGARRHAARVEDVERLGEDAAAGVAHPAHGVVGAVHGDVRAPHRLGRRVRRLRADPGDVEPVQAGGEVVPGRLGRHLVLRAPAQQLVVEARGRDGVGLGRDDEAGNAGWISVALEHRVASWPVAGTER
jgi:hypothetical protein